MIDYAVLISFTAGFVAAHVQLTLLERPHHIARVAQRNERKRLAGK